jgi:dihydrofolate reductase
VDEVSKLKQEIDGDIVVYASVQLGRALMDNDLVDELRLFVFPVVVGAGERLFGEPSDSKPLRLLNAKTIGDDLAFLTYQPVRDAEPPLLRASSDPPRTAPRRRSKQAAQAMHLG